MDSSTYCWIVLVCSCLLGSSRVHGACSEPLGVANAYITSTSPYNTNDRVYYRCYDGFTMSGDPSQECLSTGSFSGTAPTCVANDEAVTIKQTVTSPKDDGNSGWMMLAFGSFIGLILLLLIIFALVFFYFMYKRKDMQEMQGLRAQRKSTWTTNRDSLRKSNSTASFNNSCVSPSQEAVIEEPAPSEVPTMDLGSMWTPRENKGFKY